MIVELFTGAILLKLYLGSDKSMLSLIGFALIIMIWFSTFLIQVPQHKKLEKGFDRYQSYGGLLAQLTVLAKQEKNKVTCPKGLSTELE